MATQKILKFATIIIFSVSMATNIPASLIEPTITTTIVSQQNERYSVMPWNFRTFAYGMSWNLLELCLYGDTMSELRPIQTDIAVNDKLSYIPFTEGSLHEDRFEYAQIVIDGQLGIEPDIFYDWEAICEYGITPLSIQSSLDDTGFSGTELDEIYEREFVLWPFCYVNDPFYYGLSTFFEDSEQIVVTYRSDPNISSATVLEPTTLILLSFGTLVFIRKRR